jgi:hypothetical protein
MKDYERTIEFAKMCPGVFPRKIWSADSTDVRRAYLITTLREAPLGADTHLMDLAIRIGERAHDSIPASWLTRKAFHDSKFRRLITEDIRAINADPEYDGIYILTGFAGARIVSGEDLEALLRKKRAKALKILADVSRIAKKTGLQGQIEIDAEEWDDA